MLSRLSASTSLLRKSSVSRGFRSSTLLSHGANCGCDEHDTVVSRCTVKIQQLLQPQSIKVTSSNDDPNGSHIRVEVVSTQFEGKNVVQRQRLVYKALWEELNGPVHAVDGIVAKTPKEAGLRE